MNTRLKAELDRMALYAEHGPCCPRRNLIHANCDCGLTELRAELDALQQKGKGQE